MNACVVLPHVLLGAGGHAKVLLSMMKALNLPILGVCAPELQGLTTWRGVDVLREDAIQSEFAPDSIQLINGIGQQPREHNRQRVFDKYKNKGYSFPVLIHPFTCIDSTVKFEEGVQVMAGAVIQADTRVGHNVIINTCVSVDHDCLIDAHVHVAPGARLCGQVRVGQRVFIASGAVLIQGITVGDDVIIGAGVSIVRDLVAKQLILPAMVRRLTLEKI